MDAESSICLSDLVPALRWSRPQQIAEVLADPRLPAGWWSSVTLPKALGTAGLDWVCDRLARLSLSRWDHLPLSDVLPALHVHTVDPTLPDWPESARSAITGLGGWSRLRRLTAGDLGSPSASTAPEAVVTAMFREVLSRIPVTPEQPAQTVPQTAQATTQTAQPAQVPQAARGTQQPAPQTTAQPAVPATAPHPPVPHAPAGQGQQPERRAPATPPAPQQPHPAPVPEPPIRLGDYPLVGLVDNMFRDWNPLERAIAVERLFAVDPISLRALAHKLNADLAALSAAQRAAEERILLWLRSSESAPLTGHMFGLTEWLGAAATQDQLIGADPAHPVEVPTLRTPLWRVLVTLMPDRRLQDDWLVVGDLGGLRERTRQLLAGKPADADVVALLEHRLGIRAHSAQSWLDALAASDTSQGASAPESAPENKQLPRRTPGSAGHHHRGGQPIPQVSASSIDPRAALATLSALAAGNPRPHLITSQRAPLHPPTNPTTDPSRWQRIEVTSEHLRGGPVAVPEGYATRLGMRPGTLLSVTGPGDNAVVLVWRDHPVFDSLQPVLMRLNARPGDQVYVTVDGYRLDAQLPS